MNSAADVRIRPLQATDLDTFVSLIQALLEYEHLPSMEVGARARLKEDALSSPPRFFTLLAEHEGRVVGYAVYLETYSTLLGLPTLYLEDIFVLPEARRRGVGEALLRACAAEAVRRGCGRLEWQVLAWNDLAIGFYEALGAVPLHADWRCYRLDGVALEGLGQTSSSPAASG